MTKVRRTVVALVMAIALCVVSVLGFSKSTVSARASTTEEIRKVGASYPGGKFNEDLINRVTSEFGANYGYNYQLEQAECDNYQSQISRINHFINVPVDLLIVIPIDSDEIVDVLNEAYWNGITIAVIGDVNPNYPPETNYFVLGDYYELGVKHVEAISSISLDSSIHFYYFNNEDGIEYRQGVESALKAYGFTNVKLIAVNDVYEVDVAVLEWFAGRSDGEEIDEIVTYSTEIAERIIQIYYIQGYQDDTSGTEIRVFCDSGDYELFIAQCAQKIVTTCHDAIEGESGGNVIDLGFVQGEVKYVR